MENTNLAARIKAARLSFKLEVIDELENKIEELLVERGEVFFKQVTSTLNNKLDSEIILEVPTEPVKKSIFNDYFKAIVYDCVNTFAEREGVVAEVKKHYSSIDNDKEKFIIHMEYVDNDDIEGIVDEAMKTLQKNGLI